MTQTSAHDVHYKFEYGHGLVIIMISGIQCPCLILFNIIECIYHLLYKYKIVYKKLTIFVPTCIFTKIKPLIAASTACTQRNLLLMLCLYLSAIQSDYYWFALLNNN